MGDRNTLLPKRSKSQTPRLFMRHKKIFALAVIIIFGFFLWSKFSSSSVFEFALSAGSVLKTDDNGRVNVLLLGVSGAGHDGPNLTDTIMVVSYDIKTHHADLISLPRDLWSDKYKGKVNSIYEIGLSKGGGLGFAEKELGNILGLSIPYAVRLDFSGFIKAIDLVGGVDVNIPYSFDDFEYPNEGHENDMCGNQEKVVDISDDQSKQLGVPAGKQKALIDPSGKIATASADLNIGIVYTDDDILTFFPCRFQHVSFKKGLAHLDGTTALEFVRSRHGTNGEGSDFARSRRQQIVLEAFKDEVLSANTLLDPGKIVDLLKTFGGSIDTNIPTNQYLDFIKLVRQLKGTSNFVIDGSGGNPLLVTPTSGDYGGTWVLAPRGGDYNVIRDYVKKSLSDSTASASATLRK